MAGHYSRWLARSSAFTGGIEWINDGSRRERLDAEGRENTVHHRVGLTLGHAFWLGRVTFSQELGVYVFDQYKVNDPVYQRYILSLRVYRQLGIGMSIKAHRHIADFLDARFTYTF